MYIAIFAVLIMALMIGAYGGAAASPWFGVFQKFAIGFVILVTLISYKQFRRTDIRTAIKAIYGVFALVVIFLAAAV